MWRCAGTRNPAAQVGILEELVPSVTCQCFLSSCGVCLVSHFLVGGKGLERAPASAGQGKEALAETSREKNKWAVDPCRAPM